MTDGPGTYFGALLGQKPFFCRKRALLGRVFCGVLFLSRFGAIFGAFPTPWNHKNTNYSREWDRNPENQKITSGAAPGTVLGVILAHFWSPLGPIWATLAEKGAPERVPEKRWKKGAAGEKQSCEELGCPALKELLPPPPPPALA